MPFSAQGGWHEWHWHLAIVARRKIGPVPLFGFVPLLRDHSEIGVIPEESKPAVIHRQSADPARRALLKLARQAFPDDKILESLKD